MALCIVFIFILHYLFIYKRRMHSDLIAHHYRREFDDLLFKLQTATTIAEIKELEEREIKEFLDEYHKFNEREVRALTAELWATSCTRQAIIRQWDKNNIKTGIVTQA